MVSTVSRQVGLLCMNPDRSSRTGRRARRALRARVADGGGEMDRVAPRGIAMTCWAGHTTRAAAKSRLKTCLATAI
jgi:hypothetical protein